VERRPCTKRLPLWHFVRASPRGTATKARDAAADWLADLLKDGPVAVDEIKKHAEDAGSAWRTIRRDNEILGIQPRKQTFAGG
jgi:hypothetical protein